MSNEAFVPREKLVDPEEFGVVEAPLWLPFPRSPWPQRDQDGKLEEPDVDLIDELREVQVAYVQHRFAFEINRLLQLQHAAAQADAQEQRERNPGSDVPEPTLVSVREEFAQTVGESDRTVQSVLSGHRPLQLRQMLSWPLAHDTEEDHDGYPTMPPVQFEVGIVPPPHMVEDGT